MKITKVQAFLLSYPFEQPIHLGYYGGDRTILKRDAMLIRVETDLGLVGYAPGQPTEAAKLAVDQSIGPFLCGRTCARTASASRAAACPAGRSVSGGIF